MSTAVFAALADPTRRRVLDLIAAAGEATATSVAAQMPVSRPAVIKHLGVLDRAGLVASKRTGREVRFAVQSQAVHAAARELDALAAEWDARLGRIKALAELPDGP